MYMFHADSCSVCTGRETSNLKSEIELKSPPKSHDMKLFTMILIACLELARCKLERVAQKCISVNGSARARFKSDLKALLIGACDDRKSAHKYMILI